MDEVTRGVRTHSYEVRPRLVWGGLAGAVLGMAVLGLGVGDTSWPLSLAGVALLVAGSAVGIGGGALHDTHRPGLLSQEARAVARGTRRRTVRRERVPEQAARAARRADRTRRALLAGTARAQARPFAPLAALVLVTTGMLLLVAGITAYPMTHPGQLGSLRALGAGVVFTLGALRVLLGAPGRHGLACGLAVAAGLALLAGSVILGHGGHVTVFVESVGGVAGALSATVCLASPRAPATLGS